MFDPFYRRFCLVVVLLLLGAGTARSAETGEAERLLQAAQQALAAGHWDESARALAAAEKLPLSAELEHRVAVFRRDLFTVVRLNELLHYFPVDANGFNADAWIAEYRQVFAGYGLEPEKEANDAMKERGRSSAIRSYLWAALDEWARTVPDDKKTTRRNLLDFADLLDGLDESQLRGEVRAAVRADDCPHLVRLAEQANVEKLTTPTLLLLAKTLKRANESAAAVKLLRRGQQRFPDDWQIQRKLGDVLLDQEPSQAEQAILCYRAALSVSPDLVFAQLGLAEAYLKLDRFPEMERAARAVIRLQPQWGLAHYFLAYSLTSQSKYAAAEVAGREAIRLNPKDSHAQPLLGVILVTEEKWPDAEVALRHALAMQKDNVYLMRWLGVALMKQRKYDEAEKLLSEAVRRKNDFDEARHVLIDIFFNQERFAEAETVLREFLCRNNDADVHICLALVLMRQGKVVEMETQCREALRLDPTDLKAYSYLGTALLMQRKFTEAEVAFRTILQREPKHSDIWMMLALTLAGQDKNDEADRVVREGLQQLPNSALLHYLLAASLSNQKRTDEDEKEYQKTIHLDQDEQGLLSDLHIEIEPSQQMKEPNSSTQREEAEEARLEEARYDKMGDTARALAERQYELAAKPKDIDLLNDIAYRLSQMGKLAESEKYLRRALQTEGRQERTWVNLGNVLAAQGRLDDSLDALQHAMRSELAYCNIAAVLASQGKLAEAKISYHKALELDPECRLARYALTELENTSGR